jgi:hypothetical protein
MKLPELGLQSPLRSDLDCYRGTLEPFPFPAHFVFSLFGKVTVPSVARSAYSTPLEMNDEVGHGCGNLIVAH